MCRRRACRPLPRSRVRRSAPGSHPQACRGGRARPRRPAPSPRDRARPSARSGVGDRSSPRSPARPGRRPAASGRRRTRSRRPRERPRRASPAAARIVPVISSSTSLRRRVSTLPRMSTTSRSGLSASSCERRRRLELPTRAPRGTSSSVSGPASVGRASSRDGFGTNTSRTSSRSVKAIIFSPGGIAVGMSLAECTATSMRPSSSAVSSSLVKSPLSPIWPAGVEDLCRLWC